MESNCIDSCYIRISAMSEDEAACAAIGLLPNGLVWDAQRELYFKNPVDKTKSSIVHFAAFMGRMIHFVAKNYTDVIIADSQPFTSETNLDYWLNRYGWDYNNINFDFSPDGLYSLKEIIIDGIKHYVRSNENLNNVNIAIKKAIINILASHKNIPQVLNIENINNLIADLSVELIYNKSEPKVKFKHIINDLYLIIQPKELSLIDPTTNQTIINLDKFNIDLSELLLEVGKKVVLMILGDTFNAY